MSEVSNQDGDQSEVISFLRAAPSYGPQCEQVTVTETHGAMVFLAGDEVFKIKKPVNFGYMDFSTLEKRHNVCRREFELNQPHAPQLYLGIVAITRENDGSLAFNGQGIPVEWAVHMRRFEQEAVLAALASAGELSVPLARNLAAEIAAYHRSASRVAVADVSSRMSAIIEELNDAFESASDVLAPDQCVSFRNAAIAELRRIEACLQTRANSGFCRRCHGDLHMNNIVVREGTPVLFDALEFDEKLATIDVLYDLAFLLMDLDQQNFRNIANIILNRYLYFADEPANIDGLVALPLFLALRSGVRALVALTRAEQTAGRDAELLRDEARHYFSSSLGYFPVSAPLLIAVGGLSGSGKSTLATALSPFIGRAPGALHLRSDLERKLLLGVSETVRLDQSAYTLEVNVRVYEQLFQKAARALRAGHSVVVDAVFSDPAERWDIEAVAQTEGVAFTGLWLTADQECLTSRVRSRKGDASDATAEVVAGQFARGAGEISWQILDASNAPEAVLKAALASAS